MGCTNSNITKINTMTLQLDIEPSELTERQLSLVKRTMEILTSQNEELALLMFTRFICENPEFARLFPNIRKVKEDDNYDIWCDPLRKYAMAILQIIYLLITNMENKELLQDIFERLGKSHAQLGIKNYMFQKMWEAVEYALYSTLEDRMTSEIHRAWFYVFQYISYRMIVNIRKYRRNS